jgi:hypothetical protein
MGALLYPSWDILYQILVTEYIRKFAATNPLDNFRVDKQRVNTWNLVSAASKTANDKNSKSESNAARLNAKIVIGQGESTVGGMNERSNQACHYLCSNFISNSKFCGVFLGGPVQGR